jgi:Tetratricopeptide repeat
MRALFWMTCLWPGLTGLWLRGRWGSLLVAIGFGLFLNFALLRTFALVAVPVVLTEAASPVAAWVLVLGFWIAGVWLGRRELVPARASAASEIDDWFREAQTKYLKGHWIEAETLLVKVLAKRPDDAEGRLLLASVQRRTGRLAEAKGTLSELGRCETAARWALEIHTEQRRIAASEDNPAESIIEEDDPPLARAA